jgi:citrate lyase subunit beta/citryl-CoA lyase
VSEVRPRRSVLYLPASNERALEKAKTLPVDGLILDLEDAVASDAKATARELACAAAVSGAYGMRELTIRVNGLGTPWHDDDVVATCAAGPDGIVVPKVDSADEVRTLVRAMEAAGAPERTALWAMVETPRAILEAATIGSASDRLTAFVLGTNDLVKELGTLSVPGRAPVYTALSLAVLGARAAGVAVLDGVYNDVRDSEGFAAECRQGRELGFDGKTLIHPGQIETANRVFAPSADDVETAQRTIAAFEAARAEGRGVATLDGRLIESLHVEIARRTLAMADAISSRRSGP